MSDKYDVLFQKYNKVFAQVQDLQEQLTTKKEQWQKREDDFKITTKLIRELCEQILAKSPEQNALGKEKSWDDLQIDEMIHLSQKIFKEYNEERTKLMRKMNDQLEERNGVIRELEEEIQREKNKKKLLSNEVFDAEDEDDADDENINTETGEVESPSEQAKKNLDKKKKEQEKKGVVSKLNPKLQDKINKGEVTLEIAKEIKEGINNGEAIIEIEDEDEVVEGTVVDELHRSNMTNNITAKTTTKSMSTFHSKKANKKRKEMKKEVEQELYGEKYKVIEEKMNPDLYAIVKVMGDTGESRSQIIGKLAMDQIISEGRIISISQVMAKMLDLKNIGVIVRHTITTPLTSNMAVQTLTNEGAYLYKVKYNKDTTAVSEYERLESEHTSLEHGYGILLCAETIAETRINGKKIFVKVNIWNRKNPIPVGKGEGSSNIYYIPDIVCIDNQGKKMFIEYELNHHEKWDLNAKLNKMLMTGMDKLNFIVPNKEIAKAMNQRIINWTNTKGSSEIMRHITIRVTTAKALESHDLRLDNEWMFVLKPAKSKEFFENF